MELNAIKCREQLALFGRVLYDTARGALFFNWTGSGMEFKFIASSVSIDAVAFADEYPGEADNEPWLTVLIDGKEHSAVHIASGEGSYCLFCSEKPETHVMRVLKRSENSKGRMGLIRLRVDGALLPHAPKAPRFRLEFIGDSITCGFGNEMGAEETVFTTAKENGQRTYASVASELLDAEYNSLCISGIPLCWASDPRFRLHLPEFPDFVPPVRAMEDFYEYTDRFHQQQCGMTGGFERWDFSRFVPDAIVINLGTNDAFRLRVSGNDPHEEEYFKLRYIEFLRLLRRLNGEKTLLACTLGSMDYYLYDVIEKAAADYTAQSGDARVICFKFGAIDPFNEGMGGLAHPNVKTQERMGRELAEKLGKYM